MKALVVGGTGPTGPLVVQGLLDRGYEVTMYHRGYHETKDLPQVHHHLHGDPYNKDSFEQDMAGQSWDLVVGMYGRTRYVADVVAGRTPKFVAAGGPGIMRAEHLPYPQGLELPLPEDHPTYTDRSLSEYGFAIAYTESRVMEHHQKGDFAAVMFRYTGVYGPRVPRQWMWPIVRRALDGRRQIIVPGDGNVLRSICYYENAAHQLLLACDKDEGNGHIFYSVDERTYSLSDLITMIGRALNHEFEIVEITHPLAYELATGYAPRRNSQLDVFGMKVLLGYRDLVPPHEGIRQAAQWLAANRDQVDEEQTEDLVGNPFAYDIEDQLIASFKDWQHQASESIPRPQLRTPSQEFRGPTRPREAS